MGAKSDKSSLAVGHVDYISLFYQSHPLDSLGKKKVSNSQGASQDFLEISRGVLHFMPFFILSFPFTHKAFNSVEEAIVMGSLA